MKSPAPQSTPQSRDCYGPLNRTPPRPKRAILVQLRRAMVSAESRCRAVNEWRAKLKQAESALAECKTETRKRAARNRLAKVRRSLNGMEDRRNYTLRRLANLIAEAKTRTAKNQQVIRKMGAQNIAALIDRAQSVLDVVTVRERLGGRDEAFVRLSDSARRIGARLIHDAISTGLMDEDDARTRADQAVLTAAEQWRWTHASGNRFTSYAFTKIMRNLQIRTRADRPIMSVQRPDGSWSQASSLDGMAAGGVVESERFVPHAVNHHESYASPVSLAREAEQRSTVQADVLAALGQLTESDRDIAEALLLHKEKISAIAERLGVSETVVKGRRAVILTTLRESLAAYEESDDL